ncbi:MAG: DNA polymerase I [Acetivibrionales bacterium]|jgi:DNA polymerase-1|nr:DNA polymerase I [Clostridiaceae bacterium]
MSDKLLIVDGNSILNRAFYAIKGPRMLTKADGTPTNAVFGFLNILNKYLEEENPDHLAVAFDLKGKTFRHNMYEGYKANRKGMPDELAAQLPIVKNVLEAMNIAITEYEGLEADDLIGIYSKTAENEGLEVSILTGDRDALQLASDKVTVIIPSTSKGQTTTNRYTPAEIADKYGVTPAELIEVKALMGDSSDNIPGVKGVGEKTAIELIKEYGSIDKIYESISSITKAKLKENLENCKELAYLSRELGTIVREKEDLSDISVFKRKEINKKELLEIFKDLEFNSFIKKMGLAEDELQEENLALESVCLEELNDIAELDKALKELSDKSYMALLPVITKTGKVGGTLEILGIGTQDKYYFATTQKIEEDLLCKALEPVFKNRDLVLISHNIKELYTWALCHNTEIECKLFDMMVAEYLIDALATNYSIPNLARKYLGIEIELPSKNKNKGKQIELVKEDDNSIELLGKAISTFKIIYEKQKVIIDESKQNSLFYDVELPLSIVLGDMEYLGFRVDRKYLEEYGERLEYRIKTLEQTIYMLACEEFNINSPKQLGVILFEKMGLKAVKKTKTGYSTDADSLNDIIDSHEIIPCILEYRQLTKLKSTYADGLVKEINPETGRIHSSFNQTVTATGRISSTEPNLQNIPIRTELGREIRQAFIPEDGYVFVDADYSQIELRVLAHITGDEVLQNAFMDGIDIHTLTASQVFDVPLNQVTSDMRRSAKAVNFGIIYGIGDFSLAKDIGVTRKEAARYIDNYLSTYPRIRDYMENTVIFGKEKGYVETMFHRVRHIPELKSPNYQVREFGKRVAMNTPIQGSAADIIKIAMVKVWRELKKKNLKSRLILQVHDELLVETAIDELELVKEIVKTNMESAAVLAAPLVADVSTGSTWFEAK